MTTLMFRDDAYLKSIGAKVVAVGERGGIVLDQTNFYAAAGGQPGDVGTMRFNGKMVEIALTVYATGEIGPCGLPKLKTRARSTAVSDWPLRDWKCDDTGNGISSLAC